MRKAVLLYAAIAMVTGGGFLFVWKVVYSRSGPESNRKVSYTLAAVTAGENLGGDSKKLAPVSVPKATSNKATLGGTNTDKPTPPAVKPADNQPVAVTTKPADDRPVAVTTKPADERPVAVTTKPADDRPVAVTTKPAEAVEVIEVVAVKEVVVEPKATTTTKPAEAVEVIEVVAVEETVVEPKAATTTKPVEAVEIIEVVAVKKNVVEPEAAATTKPAEDKTVLLEQIAAAVTDETDKSKAGTPVALVEVAAPAEIETAEPEKTIEPVEVVEVKVEKPVEPVEVAQVKVEEPVELVESVEVVEVIEPEVEKPVEPAEPAEPVQKTFAKRIDVDKVDLAVSESGWEKPIPITFSIDYTLATDYIFRGINFSEYRRSWGQARNEGREKLNHQLTAGAELDMDKLGRVGYSVWFEWFAGQHYLTPEDSGKNLQEVDHTVYYGYTIEKLGLDIEVGFIWYMFPRTARGDGAGTQEIYILQTFDDSVIWRALGFANVKKPILNPYLHMAWDMDLARGGMYSEFGMSHDFALAELGMKNTLVLKDITVTPTWSMGWDKNWLNKMSLDWGNSHPAGGLGNEGRGVASNSSHLDFMNWGLEVNFDLKSALKIPDKYCGEMYIKGFLNYSDAIATEFLNDEFYGGMSVGFSW